MKIVIPSKGRAHTIGDYSLRLFPDATVCVDEREIDDYARTCSNLLPHPPLRFLPQIRNWILDHVEDDAFMMVDDDCLFVMSLTGISPRKYVEPNAIMQICENALECTRGIGAHLFGFSHIANPIFQYHPNDPLMFDEWIGGIWGVIGRGLRYDEHFLVGTEDIDLTLQHLMRDRIVFVDTRFHFVTRDCLRSSGGVGSNRSLERENADSDLLMRKWGKFVTVGYKDSDHGRAHLNRDNLGGRFKSIHVRRRQAKS